MWLANSWTNLSCLLKDLHYYFGSSSLNSQKVSFYLLRRAWDPSTSKKPISEWFQTFNYWFKPLLLCHVVIFSPSRSSKGRVEQIFSDKRLKVNQWYLITVDLVFSGPNRMCDISIYINSYFQCEVSLGLRKREASLISNHLSKQQGSYHLAPSIKSLLL